MIIKRIAVVGATGMLGRPVVAELKNAGFEITALVRPGKLKNKLPEGIRIVEGDLKNPTSINQLLQGQDALYISLSIQPGERKKDWHSETDGVNALIGAVKTHPIKRLILLSSLVQRYQGMNNFSWWAFDVKNQSIERVKQSGIPYTIFYPSTFMEIFLGKFRQGKRIFVSGKSEFPMYYVAGEDYGRQVARSLQLAIPDKEYVVQGPEAYTQDEAALIFVRHYPKEKLSISRVPFNVFKFLGGFSATASYGAHIVEALNRYPEKFESEVTWQELGKPAVTLQRFAETI